jgi:hypothetical protein
MASNVIPDRLAMALKLGTSVVITSAGTTPVM